MRDILLENVTFLMDLFQGVLLAWYARKFATPRFLKFYIVPVHVLIREFFQYILPADPEKTWTMMVKQLILLLLLYLCVRVFYKTYVQMSVYISISFMAISEICIMIVVEMTQLCSPVYDKYVQLIADGRISFEKGMALINNTALIMQYAMMAIYALTLWLLLRLVTRNFRFRTLKLENTELLFMISPAVTGLVLANIFRGTFFTIEDGKPRMIYDTYPFLYFLIPVVLVLILAGIVLAILSYQKLAKKNEEAIGAVLLKEQMTAMEEHVKEMERTGEENKRLRHDIKNIADMLLEHSYNTDNSHEWKAFFADVSDRMASNGAEFSTGSHVCDSLLSMKYHDAKEKMPDIRFLADAFLLPKTMKIRIYDLSILLGNALDNAIEACMGVKPDNIPFIELSSAKRKGMLLIHISNSFDGRIDMTAGEKFPASRKADPQKHGMGMENMERIADRYYGGISFEANGSVFDLHIMIQDREPVEKREPDTVRGCKAGEITGSASDRT